MTEALVAPSTLRSYKFVKKLRELSPYLRGVLLLLFIRFIVLEYKRDIEEHDHKTIFVYFFENSSSLRIDKMLNKQMHLILCAPLKIYQVYDKFLSIYPNPKQLCNN